MISSNNSRERVTARSAAIDIFPVGRPVVVSFTPPGNLSAKPVATIRYYRSTSGAIPSQVGREGWGREQRSTTLFARLSPFFSSNRDFRWSLNPGRLLIGWSARFSGTLRKFLQEPRGILTVFTSPSVSVGALFHERNQPQRTSRNHGKVIHEYGKANV